MAKPLSRASITKTESEEYYIANESLIYMTLVKTIMAHGKTITETETSDSMENLKLVAIGDIWFKKDGVAPGYYEVTAINKKRQGFVHCIKVGRKCKNSKRFHYHGRKRTRVHVRVITWPMQKFLTELRYTTKNKQ